MKQTKNLYTIVERVAPLVEGVEVERVNSGFLINVLADEFAPGFKNKKSAAAFLVDLALRQGVDPETIREAAQYSGGIPVSGLAMWEVDALMVLLTPERIENMKKRRKR